MNPRSLSSAKLAAALCLLAACSGSESAATTVPAAPTTAPVATSPETTRPTPPTTAPSTSTTANAPEPTTTPAIPPATTEPTADPLTDPAAATLAVIETAQGAWQAFHAARMSPADDVRLAALSDFYAASALPAILDLMEEYRTDGTHIVENSDVPAFFDIDPVSVELNLTAGTASVDGCQVNSFVLVKVGGNPDGSDQVLDDSVTTSLQRRDLVVESGAWKVSGAFSLEPTESLAMCD